MNGNDLHITRKNLRVAIIGGGISALACAVDLKEKGFDFTIFEKENVAGGKLVTEKIGDLIVEGGPDSYLPEKYWSVQLIRKIGLADDMLCSNDEFKGTFIYSGGRLHRLPEGVMLMVPTMMMPLATSSLISWPGKIRMGMELFVPRRKDHKDESLADFVTRRLGRECLEKIAEPLVAGIHTSNPDSMSVLAIFPRFIDMERKYGSLIKGMINAMKRMPPPNPSGPSMTYFMSLKRGHAGTRAWMRIDHWGGTGEDGNRRCLCREEGERLPPRLRRRFDGRFRRRRACNTFLHHKGHSENG